MTSVVRASLHQAPDRVLLELFEPNREMLTPKLAAWFELD
jgi:hypothetical protein